MSRRKTSVSSVMGDMAKRFTRKMTIHDPSTITSFLGSLTHLSLDDCDAESRTVRARSEPPKDRTPEPCNRSLSVPFQNHAEESHLPKPANAPTSPAGGAEVLAVVSEGFVFPWDYMNEYDYIEFESDEDDDVAELRDIPFSGILMLSLISSNKIVQ
ncbi:hypothetical protein SK128_021657, partial [Halocaridina rubra]